MASRGESTVYHSGINSAQVDKLEREIIDSIYGAALEPSRWIDTLGRLAALHGGHIGYLTRFHSEEQRLFFNEISGADKAMPEGMEHHISNPRTRRGFMPVGELISTDDLAPLDEEDDLAAAEALGVRISTSRTHLKRIFTKTGCRRQSDLIRRLLRGPLARRSPSGEQHHEPAQTARLPPWPQNQPETR